MVAAQEAAIAAAGEVAELFEELAVPAHVAVLACAWLLADLLVRAEVKTGAPVALTFPAILRQIDDAIAALRRATSHPGAKIQ